MEQSNRSEFQSGFSGGHDMRATGSLLFGVIVLNLLSRVYSQWAFEPPKSEGEECGRIGSEVWTCQQAVQCPNLRKLIQSGRRITCSNDGVVHTICCPPSPVVKSISQKKCMEYQALGTCKSRHVVLVGSSGGTRLPPFPGAVLEESITKVKREVDTMDPEDPYATVGPDDQDTPGGPNGTNDKWLFIRGGVEALPGEHPHMALIGFGVDKISWQCGGSLISERFVLSAAHCEHGKMGKATVVRLGDLDYESPTDDENAQQFRIVETYKHEDYKDPQLYNDVVLYKLDQDATFNQFVAPACLYPGVAEPESLVTVTGWGYVETHLRKPTLRKADLNIVGTEKCSDHYKSRDTTDLRLGIDGRTMLCAWGSGKDTCSGDSGGPMVIADKGDDCLYQLVGITSFGSKMCWRSFAPGGYARVATFIPWIESIVWPSNKYTGTSLTQSPISNVSHAISL